MNFKFKIGDTDLDKNEAKALFSAAGRSDSIVVDVADHVDFTMIDAKKLFNISVETKNPTLASLAARFAIEGVELPTRKAAKRSEPKKLSQIELTNEIDSPSQAIDALCHMSTIKAVGAAMILDTLKGGQTKTLRQIATSSVNSMAYRGAVSPDSQCFKGFIKDADGHYRTLVQSSSVPRSACYHASPVYNSMRDGVALLKEWGLVELKETIEFGSQDKNLSGNSKRLRRTVYAVSLSPKGLEVANEWGDITDFISHRWSTRLRESRLYAA